jgi:hypothetical protein
MSSFPYNRTTRRLSDFLRAEPAERPPVYRVITQKGPGPFGDTAPSVKELEELYPTVYLNLGKGVKRVDYDKLVRSYGRLYGDFDDVPTMYDSREAWIPLTFQGVETQGDHEVLRFSVDDGQDLKYDLVTRVETYVELVHQNKVRTFSEKRFGFGW